MTLKQRTTKRAADREFMAAAVLTLGAKLGLSHERFDDPDARTIIVSLKAPSGLQVNVDLDGMTSQPDVHVLGWNMSFESDKRLNDDTFGGSVNRHHQQKATYIAHGFEELLVQLEKGFTMANNGSAYLN